MASALSERKRVIYLETLEESLGGMLQELDGFETMCSFFDGLYCLLETLDGGVTTDADRKEMLEVARRLKEDLPFVVQRVFALMLRWAVSEVERKRLYLKLALEGR